ncbi:MAG: hypothetical protein Q8M76_02245 [Spirochaetaceae bacterium]|nr:hypothetical protein [Spirochaetaceae bacterium]
MSFSDKMRDLMNKGLDASRVLVSKAGAQAQVWGEMGALRVEIIQLRKQAEKLVAQLGAEVYAAFGERHEQSLPSASVAGMVGAIADIEKRIDEKEAAYRKLGGKDSDLEGEE